MATSTRDFNIGLYREHLEEASFLYEQRLAYLHDPEVNWPDLRDWEERFEAQIDALVVGGDLALEICRLQAAAGDAGELHAAVRVFCRQDRKDDAFSVLGALDPANDNAVRAVTQAFCHDVPKEWGDDLLRAFRDHRHLTPIVAQVVGYRRFRFEDVLKSMLAEPDAPGRAQLAWALGRVGTAASLAVLQSLVGSQDEFVCEAAAIASMRLGDDTPVQQAMLAAQSHTWARRVLAIAGDSRSVRVLLDALGQQDPDAETVLALGLLGDLGAVAPLLDLLDDSDLSEPAAVALNTITGAALYKEVFVPDEFDLDELSDEEREAHEKDGTLPTRHGRLFGNWERRALLDKAGWQSWLDQNKHRFSRQYRWRMGKPYGPPALFECLKCETSPYPVRQATYEELVVRYGLGIPFEVDLPVHHQSRFLKKIEDWVTSQSGRFANGGWYFGGCTQR